MTSGPSEGDGGHSGNPRDGPTLGQVGFWGQLVVNMTAGSSRRHCDIRSADKIACLLVILLAIASPLHANICLMPECSSLGSDHNAPCQGMKAPMQAGSFYGACVPPCCQQDQAPAQTVQRNVGPQTPTANLVASPPGNTGVFIKGIRGSVSPRAVESPPDLQLLFCILLI